MRGRLRSRGRNLLCFAEMTVLDGDFGRVRRERDPCFVFNFADTVHTDLVRGRIGRRDGEDEAVVATIPRRVREFGALAGIRRRNGAFDDNGTALVGHVGPEQPASDVPAMIAPIPASAPRRVGSKSMLDVLTDARLMSLVSYSKGEPVDVSKPPV